MKILGLSMNLHAKTELKKEAEIGLHEMRFVDTIDTMFEEIKTGKYSAVLIDETICSFLELEAILLELNTLKKKTIAVVIGESVTLKVVAGLIKAGAYDYLVKPIDGMQIIKIIEKAIKS